MKFLIQYSKLVKVIRGLFRPSSYRALKNALKAVFIYNKSLIIKFGNFWVDLTKKFWKKNVPSLSLISVSEHHYFVMTLSFSIDVCMYNSKSTCPLKKCCTVFKSWQFLRSIAICYVSVTFIFLEISWISYKTCQKLWSKTQLQLTVNFFEHPFLNFYVWLPSGQTKY